jgi:putative spermidine/putrescine transport system permease protein
VDGARDNNAGPARRWRRHLAVIGLLPFLAYVVFFLGIPAGTVMVEAFRNNNGQLSFSNLSAVLSPDQP